MEQEPLSIWGHFLIGLIDYTNKHGTFLIIPYYLEVPRPSLMKQFSQGVGNVYIQTVRLKTYR